MTAPALAPEPVDYQAMAREIWPGADWVRGAGPYATIRGCGDRTTVQLHDTLEQARWALRHIHRFWGQDLCQLKHVLIALDLA